MGVRHSKVILHTVPPVVGVPATHPCPKTIPACLHFHRQERLETEPVVVSSDQHTVRVIEPQVGVRPKPLHVVGAGLERGRGFELVPEICGLRHPQVFCVGCSSNKDKKQPRYGYKKPTRFR